MGKRSTATFLLRIPEQDLKELQITDSNSKQFARWVEQLPKANVGETARQLYQCLQELNRTEFTPKKRFYLLESLRPTIHHICKLLEKHYLNQALILSDKAKKVANLAMSLQNHLITGYKIVVLHGCNKIPDKEHKKIISTAIHRAITDTGQTLVRTYQLYHPLANYCWHELYQLYRIAEYYKLKDEAVADQSNKISEKNTITSTFCRCLLLATARPNQLRQQEITALYDATELWSNYTHIQLDSEPSGAFSFDLLSDTPPNYHKGTATGRHTQLRVIVVQDLVSYLDAFQQNPTDPDIPARLNPPFSVPKTISKRVLAELCDAWSASLVRTFNRIAQKSKIDVCIGLKATHYFAGDEKEFDELLHNGLGDCIQKTRENPFLNPDGSPFSHAQLKEEKTGDAWSLAFDGGGSSFDSSGNFDSIDTSGLEGTLKAEKQRLKATMPDSYIFHHCNLVDVSPGGYCLEWQGKIPNQVRTGELLGIRENGDTEWAIGVIRWANHSSRASVRVGVELIAPTAIACGAQIIPKTGTPSDFIRVLQLPKLKTATQDTTLLTPALVFQPGYKIIINCDGIVFKAQLQEEVASTASFSLFSFNILEQQEHPKNSLNADENYSNNTMDNFDNLWSKL